MITTWNLSCLWWVIFGLWITAIILNSLNFDLWWNVRRRGVKYYFLKATASLWEDTGRWEFWMPESFEKNIKNYMETHHVEFEQLVEEYDGEDDMKFFSSSTDMGNIDYSFRDRSRTSSYLFHINVARIIEQKPAVLRFSLRNYRTGWYLAEK